jgi:hypothetical protein
MDKLNAVNVPWHPALAEVHRIEQLLESKNEVIRHLRRENARLRAWVHDFSLKEKYR